MANKDLILNFIYICTRFKEIFFPHSLEHLNVFGLFGWKFFRNFQIYWRSAGNVYYLDYLVEIHGKSFNVNLVKANYFETMHGTHTEVQLPREMMRCRDNLPLSIHFFPLLCC